MAVAAGVVDGPLVPAGRWIARTFLGWCAGVVLGILFIIGVESLGVREVQFPLAMGMGLGVGRLQARVLQPLRVTARQWIGATTIGLSAPFAVADLLQQLDRPLPFSLVGYVALGGTLAGALQWRLLRPRGTPAMWWLAITPIGWLLGASTVWVSEAVPRTLGLIGALLYLAIVMSGGLVLGAAGAIALRLMSGTPARTVRESPAGR